MIDISVKNIVKAFEEDENILDGLTFDVYRGDRVGLIGKNGAGKTTLLRLIVGELTPDEGEITTAPAAKLGLISQIPQYPPNFTTEDVLKKAHERLYKIKAELDVLEKKLASDSSKEILGRYDRLLFEYQSGGGYDTDYERNKVANGLKIPEDQRAQLFSTLSGGEKTRVNLARLILENTDILLLDEPTNHLDMSASAWLEEYLKKYNGTVLIVSHDRYFLDKTATRTVEIIKGRASLYNGGYSEYLAEKERRCIEDLKRFEREEAETKRLQASADRLRQWGIGNKRLVTKARAIESRIARMERTERPDRERRMRAGFGEDRFAGDELLKLKGISKSYEGKTLFDDVSLLVKGGDRIALLGANGTGKSTLLKIITGAERADRGIVQRSPSAKIAYLPQIISFKNPRLSVLDTLIMDEGFSPQSARNRLGAYKFGGDDVYRQVNQLSGGEQSRLRLCVLMKDDINLLILDEPTNHMDISSREWIEEAVANYEGALLFVSHDRYFINRFAERIWELKDGEIAEYDFGYEKYTMMSELPAKNERKPVKKRAPKRAIKTDPAKVQAKIEKEIFLLEDELRALQDECEIHSTDYEKLMELDARSEELDEKLVALYSEWERFA